MRYDGTRYYYVTNLQGDVIAILDSTGATVVQYTYDAWGKVLSITGSMADTIGVINPLLYRGYIYDHDTGLYYLQSRYYNPTIERFINADAFVSTGQGLIGNNMFAYCGNNPIMYADPTGSSRLSPFELPLEPYLQKIAELLRKYCRSVLEVLATLINKPVVSPTGEVIPPSGGETVYSGQVRICTDGSDGTLVPDTWWYPETALFYNGKPLDAYSVHYVVVPLDVDKNEDLLGCSALLINHDTGMYVWCVVGDQGPSDNGWGEVSIAAIWDTGNPDHMTANSAYGLGNNYEIILYRDRQYTFD